MESLAAPANPSALHRLRDLAINIATVIWRALANPHLLLALGIAALAMVLLGLFVPQMPDPFNADAAAAARWKLGIVAAYGALSGPLEVLGIFNLLQSVLLRVLLVLIALMLAVQLGEYVGLALAFRRLPGLSESAVDGPGTPLPLRIGGRLYRERQVTEDEVDEITTRTSDALAADFADIRRHSVALASSESIESTSDDNADGIAEKEPVAEADSPGNGVNSDDATEERFLALRHQELLYLRPLMPVGLLLALAGLWLNAAFGWEVISSSLTPTERYQHPPQHLEVFYPPIIREGGAAPAIHVRLDGTEKTIAVGDDARVGGTQVITRESAPALLVRAEPAGVRLSRLGESVRVDPGGLSKPMVLGLEFPEPGREEVLALPDQAMGVRIVRLPNNTYSIELYEAGGTEPAARFDLDSDEGLSVSLPDSSAGQDSGQDSDVTLTFFPSIGAVTAVRSVPGHWLLWPALICFAAGLAGFVRRPLFVLAQIATWSPAKRVVVTQSNSQEMLAAYMTLYGALNQQAGAEAEPEEKSEAKVDA